MTWSVSEVQQALRGWGGQSRLNALLPSPPSALSDEAWTERITFTKVGESGDGNG